MGRALITGATGLLGRHLVDCLASAGTTLRVLARPGSDTRHARYAGAEVMTLNDGDAHCLASAVDGAHWVFHLAGHLTPLSPFIDDGRRSYQDATVDLTAGLLEASLTSSTVEHFVYASSVSVYGHASRPITEHSPLRPLTGYAQAKVTAELLVQQFAGRGLPTTIVRPCICYGRGDRHFIPTLLRLHALPVVPLIDGGRYRLDLVYAGDVAELLVLASQQSEARGAVYNAASGDARPIREVVERLGAVVGRTPPVCSVPLGMARRMAPFLRVLLARLAPGAEVGVSDLGLEYFGADRCYPTSKAALELGWIPRIDLGRGLAHTVPRSAASLRRRWRRRVRP